MSIQTGTSGNDTLIGGLADDELYGLDGDDRLAGAGGTNNLIGGTGNANISFVLTKNLGVLSCTLDSIEPWRLRSLPLRTFDPRLTSG